MRTTKPTDLRSLLAACSLPSGTNYKLSDRNNKTVHVGTSYHRAMLSQSPRDRKKKKK